MLQTPPQSSWLLKHLFAVSYLKKWKCNIIFWFRLRMSLWGQLDASGVNALTWVASPGPTCLKERKLSQSVLWHLHTCACTHTHTVNRCKKCKYLLTFTTHMCLPLSLLLIPEKLVLEWRKKRQEGKWISTQNTKLLVDRLGESKGWKFTFLSLHFCHHTSYVNNHTPYLCFPHLSPLTLSNTTSSLGSGHQPL